MDTAQERSGSPGLKDTDTSNNPQRKRGQAVTRRHRQILGNLVVKNFCRPRQPHASNEEQYDAPRTGVEAETPSKPRTNRLFVSLSSSSPRQPHARRILKTPTAGSGVLDIFMEASPERSQQQRQQPVSICSPQANPSLHQYPTCISPHRLLFGAGNYAKLQDEPKALRPDSYADNLNRVLGSVIANAPTGTQQQSTSTQPLAELNDTLTRSLLWKSTMSPSSPSLFEFLSCKKDDGNKPKRLLRRDLGLRSKDVILDTLDDLEDFEDDFDELHASGILHATLDTSDDLEDFKDDFDKFLRQRRGFL
jgi:hypothetical protein